MLDYADLSGATLTGSYLTGADFNDVIISVDIIGSPEYYPVNWK